MSSCRPSSGQNANIVGNHLTRSSIYSTEKVKRSHFNVFGSPVLITLIYLEQATAWSKHTKLFFHVSTLLHQAQVWASSCPSARVTFQTVKGFYFIAFRLTMACKIIPSGRLAVPGQQLPRPNHPENKRTFKSKWKDLLFKETVKNPTRLVRNLGESLWTLLLFQLSVCF